MNMVNDTEVYRIWCPTCHKFCTEFGDLIPRKGGYEVHKECGKIPMTVTKKWKP